jgi:hypothetical protein
MTWMVVPGVTELYERGEVMVTAGALVSDETVVGVGVGVLVAVGVEVGEVVAEPEALVVKAFRQTLLFG